MDKEWSEKNKKMQTLISKESTFSEGINLLLELRGDLFEQISSIVKTFPPAAFWQMPFGDGEKNHNATLAWSLWHLFRVEDIVAHTLILNDKQILFERNWIEKISSPIITTGNELDGESMIDFSKKLNVRELYLYALEVKNSSDRILSQLQYKDLKRTFTDADKILLNIEKLLSLPVRASWKIRSGSLSMKGAFSKENVHIRKKIPERDLYMLE